MCVAEPPRIEQINVDSLVLAAFDGVDVFDRPPYCSTSFMLAASENGRESYGSQI